MAEARRAPLNLPAKGGCDCRAEPPRAQLLGGPQKQQEGLRRDLSSPLFGEHWLQASLGSAAALEQQQVIGNARIHLETAVTSKGKVWSDWGDTSFYQCWWQGSCPHPTDPDPQSMAGPPLSPSSSLPAGGMLSDIFSSLSFC